MQQIKALITGDHFFTYLKDSFDALYEEGKTSPKMMSVGLHCRLIGKPGRIQSLKKFLDYILRHDDIWICKRIDIAKHWIKKLLKLNEKKNYLYKWTYRSSTT